MRASKKQMKRNYKRKLNRLVSYCRKSGIKVKFVKSLADYAGMNDEAAKKLGYHRLPDDTILIDKRLLNKDKVDTLEHEIEEMVQMEKMRLPYWDAHLKGLKAEKKGLSKFVKEEIKKGI